MKFPYQLFRGSYYPIIPVTIADNEKRVIGLYIESGEKRIFQGASAKLTGYIHSIKMVIAGKEIFRELSIETI